MKEFHGITTFVLGAVSRFKFTGATAAVTPVSYQSPNELDFLSQFLESTTHAIENFQSLKGDSYSSCQKAVLEPLLVTCVKSGVDAVSNDAKMTLAIKLAICDYEAASTAYPNSCKLQVHMQDDFTPDVRECLFELIKNPSLYNAYHSYLLKIGSICKEESLPFEKDQIVQLYFDLTKLVSKVASDLSGFLDITDRKMRALELKIETVTEELLLRFEDELDAVRKREKGKMSMFSDDVTALIQKSAEDLSRELVNRSNKARDRILDNANIIAENLDDIKSRSNFTDLIDFTEKQKDRLFNEAKDISELSWRVMTGNLKQLELHSLNVHNLKDEINETLERMQIAISEQNGLYMEEVSKGVHAKSRLETVICDLRDEMREQFFRVEIMLDDVSSHLAEAERFSLRSFFSSAISFLTYVRLGFRPLFLTLMFFICYGLGVAFVAQETNVLTSSLSNEAILIRGAGTVIVYSVAFMGILSGSLASIALSKKLFLANKET